MSEKTSIVPASSATAGTSLTGAATRAARQSRVRRDARKETRSVEEQLLALRPTRRPDWVNALQPLDPPTDGTNGLHRLVGMWPGDETDEEIERLLKEMNGEGAG